MSLLFSPLRLRELTLRNRIAVAPMCQYVAVDGLADAWHLVHLGSRAVGGAGLVLTEATAVSADARISPGDLGIWSDAHVAALQPVVGFIRQQGAAAGIQLAHAGRKGSTTVPWAGKRGLRDDEQAWATVAPSAARYADGYPLPNELEADGIHAIVQAHAAAARRAVMAGFDVIELHMGHGYLMHQFLSPVCNARTDAWGGDAAGRMKLPLEVAAAVRAQMPSGMPLFVRLSVTDWLPGDDDVPQSIAFARALGTVGVDLIDCSSGSIVPDARGREAPGFQVGLARRVREETGLATAAVGGISQAEQAERVLQEGSADLVLIGRELLRDPYWPHRAAQALGATAAWPLPYLRAVARPAAG